ncbi:uncharacterized protein LOC111045121 isoform X1 [Nilaparvata lugens]|uniref:uncharacterized protein LOC111045121 isoform X1 n=1 Tax=Nilaparvata lugens TaxID=108931 RepID=UPI00193E9181|nr:uncharacterized protein LOC111045121 isoform X1 [Nilaparvata lugens]
MLLTFILMSLTILTFVCSPMMLEDIIEDEVTSIQTSVNFTRSQENVNNFGFFTVICYPWCVCSMGISAHVTGYYLFKKHRSTLYEYYAKYSTLLELEQNRNRDLRLFSKFCLILIFPLIPNTVFLIVFICMNYNGLVVSTVFIVLNFLNVSSNCCEAQFCTISYTLKLAFSKLNKKLDRLVEAIDTMILWQVEEKSDTIEENKKKSIENKEHTTISLERTDHLHNKMQRSMESTHSHSYYNRKFSTLCPKFYAELKTSHSMYRENWRLFSILKSVYSLQMLFSITSLFGLILLSLHFLIMRITGKSSKKAGFNTVDFYLLHNIVRFILLLSIGQQCSTQAKQVKHLVASLNNRFLDKESKEELMIFSNYVMSHEVEFAAYGFFTLNMRLLTSAIAAGTTYLVILVQFHSG